MKRICKLTSSSTVLMLAITVFSTTGFALGTTESRGACRLYMGRVSLLHLGYPESRSHHCLPRAREAEYQQALPGSAERQWARDHGMRSSLNMAGARLSSSVSQVIGYTDPSNAVSRFACTRGATCRTINPRPNPPYAAEDARSTASRLPLGVEIGRLR
jgi:hypothetical protein